MQVDPVPYFGEASPPALLAKAAGDQLRYSVPAIRARRRRAARLAWQPKEG